jgi:hypothetical protein
VVGVPTGFIIERFTDLLSPTGRGYNYALCSEIPGGVAMIHLVRRFMGTGARLLRPSVLLFLTLFIGVQPLSAEEDRARAALSIKTANEAYNAGDFRAALLDYRRAFRYSKDSRVLYRIGLTYENLSNYQRAREHFELFLLSNPSSKHAGKIKRKVDNLRKLESTMQAFLEVDSRPLGAEVFLDGDETVAIGATTIRVPMGPGAHNVMLTMEGQNTARFEVDVPARQSIVAVYDFETGSLERKSESAATSATGPPAAVDPVEPLIGAEPESTTDPDIEEPSELKSEAEFAVAAEPAPVEREEPVSVTTLRLAPSKGVAVMGWGLLLIGTACLTVAGVYNGFGLTGSSDFTGFLLGSVVGIGGGGYILWFHKWGPKLPKPEAVAEPDENTDSGAAIFLGKRWEF